MTHNICHGWLILAFDVSNYSYIILVETHVFWKRHKHKRRIVLRRAVVP